METTGRTALSSALVSRNRRLSSTLYLILITCVAALGGLLFGYDTAVISGAIGLLQVHFALTAAATGWAASSALAGCVLGAALAGNGNDRYGRHRMLLIAGICLLCFGHRHRARFNVHALHRVPHPRRGGGRHSFSHQPALYRRVRTGEMARTPRRIEPAGHRGRHADHLLRQLSHPLKRHSGVEPDPRVALDVCLRHSALGAFAGLCSS